MDVPLAPSARSPKGAPRVSPRVGTVRGRDRGRVVRAGVRAIAGGLVPPRDSRRLRQELALPAERPGATFALASRATCYGVGRRTFAAEETLELNLAARFSTAFVPRADHPSPRSGDLEPEATQNAAIECATFSSRAPAGFAPREDRPGAHRAGILSRVLPLEMP